MSRADGPRAVGAEETTEELYEEAPCGYVSTADDGTIVRANRTFVALAGYRSADELVGRLRFYDLLPPGGKIYYETHYAPLLRMQDQVRELALELLRPDGSRVPVLLSAVRKADLGIVRITVFDASERRSYERELMRARTDAEERAAAASALEHVAEAVVLVDEEARVVVLNPAARRILGLPDDDVRGLPLASLVPGWQAIARRLELVGQGPTVVPIEPDGDARWLAVSSEHSPRGVVYTIRDVTEERRFADMRDEVVAVVSHELRTPLTAVWGAAQTLAARGETLEPEQRSMLLQTIAEQTGRLARIVEEVLLTRRLDNGVVPFEREAFDLVACVAAVTTRSAAWRLRRAVELDAPDALRVEADRGNLEQVLVNLLDNAMKFSPEHEAVRVSVAREGANARVVVADAGPGVPAADRERIFEKFVRLDPGRSGTGLGLYISRELVRRMHGRIGVLPSERGAAFFVDLPLARD